MKEDVNFRFEKTIKNRSIVHISKNWNNKKIYLCFKYLEFFIFYWKMAKRMTHRFFL